MKTLSKVIGIISWLPDKEPDRTKRLERFNRLLIRLEELWPDIDILIITQNWKDFKPVEVKNKVERVDFEKGLGILQARKTLREEFLKRQYDYIIMFDDDAIIKCDTPTSNIEYLKTIDEHPDGFAFVSKSPLLPKTPLYELYAPAQLNLCAISRFIYEKEPMVDCDVKKGEGYEDLIFSHLLHYKYPNNEFHFKDNIRCIQYLNKDEPLPSTWETDSSLSGNSISARYYVEEFKKGNFNLDSIKISAKYSNNFREFSYLDLF